MERLPTQICIITLMRMGTDEVTISRGQGSEMGRFSTATLLNGSDARDREAFSMMTSTPRSGVSRAVEVAMANNLLCLSVVCFVVTVSGCGRSTQETTIRSVDELSKNVGKVVVLFGEPVGSKANYALRTEFAMIPLDSAWDSSIYDPAWPKPVRVCIRARLDREEATEIPLDGPVMQSNQTPGQKLPAHYVLRDVEIVEPRP